MDGKPSNCDLTLNPDNSSHATNLDPENGSPSIGTYSVGTVDEDMLSDEERQAVERFANEIDILNVDQIARYGESAQRGISEFSTSILKEVSTRDLDEIGESLKDLTVALDATLEPERKGLRGLFQRAKQNVDSIRASFAKAESNVSRIEGDLIAHQSTLIRDISTYQQMYDLNMEHYKELTMYILAGRKALDEARLSKLPAMRAVAERTGRQEDLRACGDFEEMCHRFEKKLSNLEITRIVSIQSATQIRMLQGNDREMLDKLQSSISNAIPLWRNQLVLSLGIDHAKRALDAQNAITDKVNELLAKNSEALKVATVETARASERPIVDIDVLDRCNKDLIFSVKEVMKIHAQAEADRDKARSKLIHIEAELKQALLEPSR